MLSGIYMSAPRGDCCSWCTIARPHELTTDGPLVHPGGKNGMFRTRCSCGYSGPLGVTPQAAEKPALAHQEAKRRRAEELLTLGTRSRDA